MLICNSSVSTIEQGKKNKSNFMYKFQKETQKTKINELGESKRGSQLAGN